MGRFPGFITTRVFHEETIVDIGSVSKFALSANNAGWPLQRTANTLNALGIRHHDGQEYDVLDVLRIILQEQKRQLKEFPENNSTQARAVWL